MTIKASGTGSLSFEDDIEKEFGENPSRSLGSYRRDHPDFSNKNCGSLTNLPLDDGIPTSGEIKFSDFYGKKLNIVVDYYSVAENREDVSNEATMAATYRYVNQNAKVKIVGGYQSKPTAVLNQNTYNLTNTTTNTSWQGGKKVFINVNKTIGGKKSSDAAGTNLVALRTGGWPSGTSLQIDIGASGSLRGAGGDGRQGTTSNGTPTQANAGSSALGIEYPAQINNSGNIQCGYGGGGGGGGANSDPNKSTTDYGRSGGGGGGGAGVPAGNGGAINCGGYSGKSNSPVDGDGNIVCGGAGGNGSSDAGGTGGTGADHAVGGGGGGNGGIGGDIIDPAANGTKGSGSRMNGAADQQVGAAGPRGYGIIYGSTGIQNACSGNTTVAANKGGVIVGGIF